MRHCAESADRHRQLLKLAVQDVYVRQHARSAPTQISAQYTPNQAYAPTVYAHPRTDDQPRTPWYPQAQCAMPYATGRDRTRRVPSSGRVSARIRTQADTKGINITWEICQKEQEHAEEEQQGAEGGWTKGEGDAGGRRWKKARHLQAHGHQSSQSLLFQQQKTASLNAPAEAGAQCVGA